MKSKKTKKKNKELELYLKGTFKQLKFLRSRWEKSIKIAKIVKP